MRIIVHTKYDRFVSSDITKDKFEEDVQMTTSEFIEMLFDNAKHFNMTSETGSILHFPKDVLKTSVIEIEE